MVPSELEASHGPVVVSRACRKICDDRLGKPRPEVANEMRQHTVQDKIVQRSRVKIEKQTERD